MASRMLSSSGCAFLLITRRLDRTSSDAVSLVGRLCSCDIRRKCRFCYLASSPSDSVRS